MIYISKTIIPVITIIVIIYALHKKVDIYDEFFIAVKFKVDSLEDTINIPFYAIDDFNYDETCVDHRVLDLDAQANIDGLPYSVWSDERRLLRLAYLIWMEVRSWL